eukprot:SAG11_NODE_7554_length_1129_cov_3.039806_1_plen_302_part_10
MDSSGELKRSSIKKRARADAARHAFIAAVHAQHGETAYKYLLGLHDEALSYYYAEAITNGWQPSEISALFCLDDVRQWMKDEGHCYHDDFYKIVWESKFGEIDDMAAARLHTTKRARRTLDMISPSNETGLSEVARASLRAEFAAAGVLVTQTWFPTNDDDTSPQQVLQETNEALLDVAMDTIDKKAPAEEFDSTKHMKELYAALKQPGADTSKIMAEIFLCKELGKGSRGDGMGSISSKRLPDELYQSYGKKGAKISISEHLEKVDDFLLTQPKSKHLDFLFLSLTGDTLKKFRKYYQKYK